MDLVYSCSVCVLNDFCLKPNIRERLMLFAGEILIFPSMQMLSTSLFVESDSDLGENLGFFHGQNLNQSSDGIIR